MNRITASLTRIDGINTTMIGCGGIDAKVTETPHISAHLNKISAPFCVRLSHRVGGELSAFKIGGITCTLIYVWDTNIGGPYLEISPSVIWVYSNTEATNEVISNTLWEIE